MRGGGAAAALLQQACSLEVILGLTHEVDEDVLERRRRSRPGEAIPLAVRGDGDFERGCVTARDVQARTKGRHHVDTGARGELAREGAEPLTVRRTRGVG